MAVYNAGLFLEETLQSLRNQTFSDFEVIAVNDGSVDGSGQILEEFCKLDPRFRVYHNDHNRGLVYTRNRTMELAQAPLVAIADADDILHPQRFAAQIEFMRAHPEVGVLGTAVDFSGDEGVIVPTTLTYLEDRSLRFFMRMGPCLWNTTTLYRRGLIQESGGYRDGYDHGAEDYDLWARLLERTIFANLAEELVTVRLHTASVTAQGDMCHHNVMEISARLISGYLGRHIDHYARDAMHQLLMHQGMKQDDCLKAFDLVRAIYAKAKKHETADTQRLFSTEILPAIWAQANSTVYEYRCLSLRLAIFSMRLAPSILGREEWYSYLCRWLTPDAVRQCVKRFLK